MCGDRHHDGMDSIIRLGFGIGLGLLLFKIVFAGVVLTFAALWLAADLLWLPLRRVVRAWLAVTATG